MAKLYFRYGAMNSGKSTIAMQVAYNYEERGMHVLLIKPAVDTKGSDKVLSRLGAERKVDILATPKIDLAKAVRKWSKEKYQVSCVVADEAQFLTPKQIDQLFDLAVQDDIPVICYGLRTDFRTHAFPGSLRLMETAHSLEELKTICRCGKKAIFNGRKRNGKFIFAGSQVAIDGKGAIEYESLCGKCYLDFKAAA